MAVHSQGCRGKAFCSCGGDDRVGVEMNPAKLREDLRARRRSFDTPTIEQVMRHHLRFVREGDAVHVLGIDDAASAVQSFATLPDDRDEEIARLTEALRQIANINDVALHAGPLYPRHLARAALGDAA